VTTTRKRLEQIAVSLTPQQAFRLWLEEMQRFDSLAESAHWLKDQPTSAYPLYRLPDQVEESVRTAMKGQDHDRIERAVRSAVKEVAFLYYLHSQLNGRLLSEKRALWLHLALTCSGLKDAFRHDDAEALTEWTNRAALCLGEAYLWRGVVERIAERYYQGGWPLFPDTTRQVQDFLEQAQHVVELYNDHLELLRHTGPVKRRTPLPPPVEVTNIAAQAEPAIQYLVELAVDLAKFQASELVGERDQAFGYLERHV
jgi:hypothetical protein